MKGLIKLLPWMVVLPTFAMGMQDKDVAIDLKNFVALSGGYYNSNYQRTTTDYQLGLLDGIATDNHSNDSGYLQLALGRTDHIDGLSFAHQIVVSKLFHEEIFTRTTCNWFYRQNVDFGYDWMPSINLFERWGLGSYGILGAHYARFVYEKIPFVSSSSISTINTYQDQLGFNLGAGVNYRLNDKFLLGLKYQHLQYASVQNSGVAPLGDQVNLERISPAFNLVGLELRYLY
ncbi:MAG: hypothetical protein ACOYKA_02795 [Legionellaceae bacterium]